MTPLQKYFFTDNSLIETITDKSRSQVTADVLIVFVSLVLLGAVITIVMLNMAGPL